VLAIAPDQSQARVQRDYIAGALESSPLLSRHIARQTTDTVELDNDLVIEVRAANFRRLRGVTCVAVVASESAFWYADDSANPDREILRAVRPTLLTTQGPLIQIRRPLPGLDDDAMHRADRRQGGPMACFGVHNSPAASRAAGPFFLLNSGNRWTVVTVTPAR
jgi:hypothetical protein